MTIIEARRAALASANQTGAAQIVWYDRQDKAGGYGIAPFADLRRRQRGSVGGRRYIYALSVFPGDPSVGGGA
jgi:hypothetical protein